MSENIGAVPSSAPARPAVPDRLEDLEVAESTVHDLALRYLWLHGSATLTALNQTLKLSFAVLETVYHQFRQQHLIEVNGMMGDDYSFKLSAGGQARAEARASAGRYVGPAPVSLAQYNRVVMAQTASPALDRESLRDALGDLVVPDGLLDALGPALVARQPLLLYGGVGSGKTSIAQRIPRIFRDTVVIPYAVEVAGNVVSVFDPAIHKPVAEADDSLDPRWVVCERPCVTVGGELTAAMLELRRD
ncbi:MAG TPA: hypothetical protein VMU19_15455, partial [Bryobacteraceae bacterium]|nr:hypothetical protein [Bryobacteraceae bacterium]